ncbi:MAG: T9SS type A sorting domain-containing protein, partial [Bacteroidetes bacterium]|nr:T9SS type A sorting domain-containing protein [Bacteroidota bacterium]
SNDYGVPPFDILFENQTENATDYAWYVNDKLISTKENPVLSFADEGMQLVKLVAENEQGCADSMSVEINSASPQIDISLHKMQLIENGGSHKILLDIGNYSNIPLERLQATIRLENDFEITETILQRINVNEQSVVSLNPGFSLSAGNLSYLCVTLSSFYQEEDQTPGNNENCVSIQPKATVELPFPNPSSDRITVRAVFPISGDVGVAIIDMAGQVRHRERLKALPKGLNTFVIDLLKLNAGTYFLKIDYKGGTYKTRIIKQ